MKYIVHHNYNGMATFGEMVNFTVGMIFDTIGQFVATSDAKAICAINSEVGHKHFARNDDGQGLIRGKLTHAIAYGDRQVSYEVEQDVEVIDEETGDIVIDEATGEPKTKKETVTMTGRFTPEEIDMIETDFPEFDKTKNGVLLFSNDFFAADIDKLQRLAERLHIEVD